MLVAVPSNPALRGWLLGAGAAMSMLPCCIAATTAAAAPSAGNAPFYANAFEKSPKAADLTVIGRELFFDAGLSASGTTACASCHVPARAFGPPNDAPVQRGGRDGRQSGVRAVPSLMYTQNVPSFTEHYVDDEGDDSIDQGPAGGRTWDGRSPSTHDQAQLPLFSPYEMANDGIGTVVRKVRQAAYAERFREVFGAGVFGDETLAFKAVMLALETFQQSPAEFYPYSSKYDAWLRQETELSPEELRGLAAFNDPAKGNCARCHPSSMREGAFPQFTDFGYAALGAPRNRAIPANADPRYYDLGLCGPLRTDLAGKTEYCGMFRTPSLRNVATRRVFFHNGVFHRLEEVVRFYAERDTRPGKWYSHAADGKVRKFDDLPPAYRGNVERSAPFDRQTGEKPSLSEPDIRDILAFLKALTDGYAPKSPRRVNQAAGITRALEAR